MQGIFCLVAKARMEKTWDSYIVPIKNKEN